MFGLESGVVEDIHEFLHGFRIFTIFNKKLYVILDVLGVNLHVPSKDFDSSLSGCRPSEAFVQSPDPVVLCDRQSAKGPVEGSSSLGHHRLLEQEGEVHFPNARHLVQEDQGSFEECVDFLVLGAIDRGIAALQVVCSELQILGRSVKAETWDFFLKKSHLPSSRACRNAVIAYKRAP